MDDRHTSAESNVTGHARIAPDTGTGTGHLRLGPWPFDADDGFCADLDAPAGERGIVVRAGWHMSGPGATGSDRGAGASSPGSLEPNRTIPGSVARAIIDAVDTERARAAQADIAIRAEIDPHAAGLPASQVGAILAGLLARAVDACLGAASRGDAPLDGDEIVVVARLDGSWLHLHVIDGAAAPSGCTTDTMGLGSGAGTCASGTREGNTVLSMANSTARSIGGTLELRNVPFGPGTLATARLPLTAFAAVG
jgi:hypothetical protein